MRRLPCLILALSAAAPARAAAPAVAQDVTEPSTGVGFAPRIGDLSLLGVGRRTRTIFSVKVYAIGLYVADSALAGPLAVHRGKLDQPAFYNDLLWGDFPKQAVLRFVRDVSTDQIRDAFRESLSAADPARVRTFLGYFGDIKAGQECVLRWTPPGTLETTMAGQAKPPIADKDFAAAVFGVWLGPKPVQEDIKKGLVSRAPTLIR
jgi:hypothetical protein